MAPDQVPERRAREADPLLRAFHRVTVPRIRRRLARLGPAGRRRGRPSAVPYSGGPEPLALEATLERMVPGLPRGGAEVLVESRSAKELSLLILMDTSLSMAGRGRMEAAVAGAVLAREAAPGRLGLIGFHARPEVLVDFGRTIRPLMAAYRLLAQPWGGVTDLEAALKKGLGMISGRRVPGLQTILISDAERTAGQDPLPLAARFGRLHVVLIGRRNQDLALELARRGKGVLRRVEGARDLVPALTGLLESLGRGA